MVKVINSGMRLPGFGPYFCHLLLCDFGLVTLSLGFSFLISRMGTILRPISQGC